MPSPPPASPSISAAIDSSEEGVARLRRRDGMLENTALKARVARIEDADWPEADLINASFVLPLLDAEAFGRTWTRIGLRLRPGGRFAGQLYGPKDGWADRPGMTTHDRAAVERLASGFIVERLDEVETDEPTARGKPKHWHVFHLVLRKR